ncbi:flagellar protein FlaF [Natronoarchaeum philippinense]|uniref:Flagellar protein FlaF n=1 Tax=Natronoarchaeum philippinense TaxID=558529 RepID=A0A285NCC0_NATPI|nr:flagellin [Natronoarchaeum philippinense]SNZ05596.1 flagellar protein FlaF [Natronoarchaeum philippinense]
MGFSTSAAVAVVSIGVLISVGLLYPAVEQSVQDISDATDQRQDRMLDTRNSDALVYSASYNATSDVLNVTVNNTGTVTMGTAATDLLVDGRLATNRSTFVGGVGGRELWVPGEQLRIAASNVTTAPERVVVVTGTGLERTNTSVAEVA